MDFGQPESLRALSSRLGDCSQDTELLHAQISRGLSSLVGNVSSYEHRAVQTLHGRWDDVGSALQRLVSGAEQVSHSLTTLASSLDSAERQWTSAASCAHSSGFSVFEGVLSATVTAPAASGTDQAAQDHHDDQVRQAADLERRMNDAARNAQEARRTLAGLLAGISTSGLSDLGGSQSGAVSAQTGDPSVDEDLRRVTAPMLAVHQNLSRTAH